MRGGTSCPGGSGPERAAHSARQPGNRETLIGWKLEEKNLKLSHLTLPKAQFPMDVAEEGRGRFVVAQDRFRCIAHPRCVAGGEGEEVGHVQGVRVQRVLLQD